MRNSSNRWCQLRRKERAKKRIVEASWKFHGREFIAGNLVAREGTSSTTTCRAMKILDRHDFAKEGNTFFNRREGRLAKRSGIVRCEMHYSQGKSTRLFEYTFVAVSINSWESATRAIDCVSLKPGGGAGSDPEILNDRAPSTRACSLPPPRTHVSRRARTPPRRTPSHYFTGPPYTGILAGLWCRRVYN